MAHAYCCLKAGGTHNTCFEVERAGEKALPGAAREARRTGVEARLEVDAEGLGADEREAEELPAQEEDKRA